MKARFTFAILFSVLILSMLPIIDFLTRYFLRNRSLFLHLFSGQAGINIDVARDSFDIFSKIDFSMVALSLSYVVVVTCSVVIFIVFLILLCRQILIRIKEAPSVDS